MAETTRDTTSRTTARKTTKKPAATKTATRRSTTRKAPAKKATTGEVAKKAPSTAARGSRGSSPSDEDSQQPTGRDLDRDDSTDQKHNDARAGRRGASRGGRAAVLAAQQLVDLTGKEFEGIIGIARTDDGWTAQVEILEMRRIPDTTDVLAVYEVSVDGDGDLVEYRRTDRYTRGSAGEDRR